VVQNSLTILLPVKNAQNTLASTVQEILDDVSELTERLELLIIDDGSNDATSEVATELTRNFPQVRAICHVRSLGRESAIRRGLRESTGEVVLIQEQEGGKPLDEIIRTWKTSLNDSRLFFRKDSAENRKKFKAVESSKQAANQLLSKPQNDRQHQPISRPVRPNFLVRSRSNAFDN
jgi:glycosyltransferase involved in cell wall biosynthesis